MERLSETIIGIRGEPCTGVLVIPGLVTLRDAPSIMKYVASEGHRSLTAHNIWITAGDRPTEFRGTVHLRGTTDWGKFINIVAQTCADNRCLHH
jgi:hypothetical protein